MTEELNNANHNHLAEEEAAAADTATASALPEDGTTADIEQAEAEEETSAATAKDMPPQDALEAARAEAEEFKAGWQRERAEFQNFRRRVDRERKELAQKAAIDVFQKLLPIIDDLERGFENIPAELADNEWVSGMNMIHKKFAVLLANEGIQAITPVGEAFDPMQHEAIGTDNSDEVESGHVTVVLQKGYMFRDTLLRPALVRVAN